MPIHPNYNWMVADIKAPLMIMVPSSWLVHFCVTPPTSKMFRKQNIGHTYEVKLWGEVTVKWCGWTRYLVLFIILNSQFVTLSVKGFLTNAIEATFACKGNIYISTRDPRCLMPIELKYEQAHLYWLWLKKNIRRQPFSRHNSTRLVLHFHVQICSRQLAWTTC